MGKAARRAAAQAWLCRSCVNPRDGKPWFNTADAMVCKMCKLAKGSCYRGPKKPATSSPSTSTKSPSADLAKQIADLKAEADRQYSDRLTAEKERLEAELFADRPFEDKATSITARVRSARAKVEKLQKTRALQQQKIDELVAERAQSDSQMEQAEADLQRPEEEDRKFMVMQPPDTEGKGMDLDAAILRELEAFKGTLDKLRAVKSPSPPPPAEGGPAHVQQHAGDDEDPDLMDVDALDDTELRATLSEAGLPQQDTATAEVMRTALKRLQSALCKKGPKKARME
ncbi:unnamed protein product [Prorocentrum cordatum]|uniref:LEM domain-containing protein n=1 Tax=Prorocentrum cordatum TaxID=2364126 RepID=A0ABN9VJ70_9DINO|nr:unnamed protein product [Polarella glacialis]